MKQSCHLLSLLLCLLAMVAAGQTNFREGWEKVDPVPNESKLELAEKLKAHQGYLDMAIAQQNSLHQLYGKLYLATDFLRAQDYAEATRYLLDAETIAKAANESGWQGWVKFRLGAVSVKMKNYEAAVKLYETATTLCGQAKDSLCLAESLEQTSIMYGMLDDFEKAKKINAEAMPLLKKYGEERQLATALGNFGIINSLMGHSKAAIPYFDQAIELHRKLKNTKEEAKALNNLADEYRKLKQYDLAIKTFQHCIQLNLDNKLPENLIRNYVGLGSTYDSMGNYRAALEYLEMYHDLKDSLIGAETQNKIAELQVKFETQEKAIELEKSKSALHEAQRKVAWRTALLFIIALLVGIGLWRWKLQTRIAKQQQALDQQALSDLTRILMEKNAALTEMQDKINNRSFPSPAPADFETDLFNQHILTQSDWASFKAYFEKANPGFLRRLRTAFPDITDAEERLFLLIKINLTTKESATMLGISADSVKKTRTRLRKRLALSEEVDLDGFIRGF